MIYDEKSNDQYLKERLNLYTNFSKIDDNRYNYLLDKTKSLSKLLEEELSMYENKKKSLLFYHTINKIRKIKGTSYDEKIFIILNIIDPNMTLYQDFLNYKKQLQSVSNIYNVKEKNFAKSYNSFITRKFEDNIFENIGISNIIQSNWKKIFIQYERDYINTFYNKTLDFISIDDSYKQLLLVDHSKLNFEISKERLDEIINQANNYLINYPNASYKNIAYQLVNQSNLFNLNTIEEKLIFFIYTIDPNLMIDEIYEDSNNWKEIKHHLINLFKFFEKNLVLIEHKYVMTKKN